MKRYTVRMAMVLLAILAGSGRHASAFGDVKEMLGRWTGFVQGVGNPEIDTAFLNISSAKNRRFQGEIHGVDDPEIKIEGTLSAAGVLDLQGPTGDGGKMRLVAHGRIRSVGNPDIRLAGLTYKILDGKGKTHDSGRVLVMQAIGGAAWEQTPGTAITGPWRGDLVPEPHDGPCGLAELSLLNYLNLLKQRTALVVGSATLAATPQEGSSAMSFDLQGTVGVGDPQIRDGAAGVGLMGQDAESGTIAILFGLVRPEAEPAGLEGSYLLFEDLADASDWVALDADTSLDLGDFVLKFDWGVTYKLVTDVPGNHFGSSVEGTITFPWWSIGAATLDIHDALSFDFHIVDYGFAGPGWSSGDPAVNPVNWNDLPAVFAVGKIGDPILRPSIAETGEIGGWVFYNSSGPVDTFGLHVYGGLDLYHWGWAGELFGEFINDLGYSTSQSETSWHLERCIP